MAFSILMYPGVLIIGTDPDLTLDGIPSQVFTWAGTQAGTTLGKCITTPGDGTTGDTIHGCPHSVTTRGVTILGASMVEMHLTMDIC
jgi:hypothetical protein